MLALDISYQPVTVMSWMKAVTLILTDKADPVVESDFVISSPTVQIFMPSVIRLRTHVPSPQRRIKLAKSRAILETHKWTCCYCGTKAKGRDRQFMTIDHVLPRSRGGSNDPMNLVPACRPCNERKADKTPEEAGMRMLFPARIPKWDERLVMSFTARDGTTPEAWAPYITS